MQVNMHEAQTQLSRLGELVWQGERVVITKAGKPYLELVPHCAAQERKPGRFAGQIQVPDDFNAESAELIAAFEGEL